MRTLFTLVLATLVCTLLNAVTAAAADTPATSSPVIIYEIHWPQEEMDARFAVPDKTNEVLDSLTVMCVTLFIGCLWGFVLIAICAMREFISETFRLLFAAWIDLVRGILGRFGSVLIGIGSVFGTCWGKCTERTLTDDNGDAERLAAHEYELAPTDLDEEDAEEAKEEANAETGVHAALPLYVPSSIPPVSSSSYGIKGGFIWLLAASAALLPGQARAEDTTTVEVTVTVTVTAQPTPTTTFYYPEPTTTISVSAHCDYWGHCATAIDTRMVITIDTLGNEWTSTAAGPGASVATITTSVLPGGMFVPYGGRTQPIVADLEERKRRWESGVQWVLLMTLSLQ